MSGRVEWVDDDAVVFLTAWLDGVRGSKRRQRYGCGATTVPTMVCTTICPGGFELNWVVAEHRRPTWIGP